jgi:glycosyltransferase involved in cell wall biosynthesis
MLVPELISGKSPLIKRFWIWLLERRNLASAAAIHVTSEEEANGVRQLGLDLTRLEVIGNGVELPDRLPTHEQVEALWRGVPPGLRVAFLGRLDWTKGVDLAIEAVAHHPAAWLLIAGHDQIGLRATLEPRLLDTKRGPCGCFVGPVEGDEKWAVLAGADVLLAPSIKESFGMAVAEALAVGTPVICSDGVGAGSIVRRIDHDCVVARTPEAFQNALGSLLANQQRRTSFSQRAIDIMAQEYSWVAVARQVERLYEAMLCGSTKTEFSL